jgi:predicted O-methyltransferase YrrM
MAGTYLLRAQTYLHHLRKRRSIQYIHSPFLYALMLDVFNDTSKNQLPLFHEIEQQRKKLLQSSEVLSFKDLGAGGDGTNGLKQVKVARVARRSLKQARYARFLYRLAKYLRAVHIVELGTSLGITTAYLSAVPGALVHTVEGDANIREVALANWAALSINHVDSHVFNLNEKWQELVHSMDRIDLLFIDANHKKEAMLLYYQQAKPRLHEKSVVVFDDIYWSEDTQQAWEVLKKETDVTLSLDIFQMGILFFDKNLSKENFILKY